MQCACLPLMLMTMISPAGARRPAQAHAAGAPAPAAHGRAAQLGGAGPPAAGGGGRMLVGLQGTASCCMHFKFITFTSSNTLQHSQCLRLPLTPAAAAKVRVPRLLLQAVRRRVLAQLVQEVGAGGDVRRRHLAAVLHLSHVEFT